MSDNVVPFPPRLRVIAAPEGSPSLAGSVTVMVDHNGRAYRLADLLVRLSSAELGEVEGTAPRSGQAAWDEVVRRWPALADEIVAGCQIVG